MSKKQDSDPAANLPGIGELPLDELKDKIADWKKKHGDIHEITAAFGDKEFVGIFRVPNEKDIESAKRDEITGLEGNREICRRTVLYPEPIAFNDLVQKNWAFCTPIAEELIKLTNLTTKAKVKKL